MKIAVFGTGNVGQTIAGKLQELGHSVFMGSRTKDNAKMLEFSQGKGVGIQTGTFEEAAEFGDIVFNCTNGQNTLNALKQAGEVRLSNKILIDLANPLDFSHGMPPLLNPVNTTSLGEQIQSAFPETKVIKTLNTMWCGLMVNPSLVNDGNHQVFMSGNDAETKAQVQEILESFGWKPTCILDLGDISTSRGVEMYLPLWLRIWGAKNNGAFNIQIVS
jgi:predicted dinucleotide-binding enzyme